MLKKLFGKKAEEKDLARRETNEFVIPLDGTLIELSQVPDEVFAKKMMGDGFAIDPIDGEVVSPVDGTVVSVFPTKHAIGITTGAGQDILIHVGIDTVNLNGKGFEILVKQEDRVKAGQPLLRVDLDIIKAEAKSTITPIIFTNLKENQRISFQAGIAVKRGEKDKVVLIEE